MQLRPITFLALIAVASGRAASSIVLVAHPRGMRQTAGLSPYPPAEKKKEKGKEMLPSTLFLLSAATVTLAHPTQRDSETADNVLEARSPFGEEVRSPDAVPFITPPLSPCGVATVWTHTLHPVGAFSLTCYIDMAALMLNFWDSSGQKVIFDGNPPFFDDKGKDTPERRAILEAAELATGSAVMQTWKRAAEMNLTLEARLADGRHVIIRQRHRSDDEVQEAWSVTRFEGEIFLLQWLRRNTSIPVPTLFSIPEDRPRHTIAMEKLPGENIMDRLTFYSPADKERLMKSYANIVLELFKLNVPQMIGTTAPGVTRDEFKVVPIIGPYVTRSADSVFDTLEQYFGHLFQKKRLDVDHHLGEDEIQVTAAMTVLDKLEDLLQPLIQGVDPSLRRCILVHEDLHYANALADAEGDITAVIDWEFHALLPAILGVGYPSWWARDAIDDPRYAHKGYYWLCSQEDGQQLCDLYLSYVTERDAEYGRALTQGALLRGAVKWLKCQRPDHSAQRLARWMKVAFAEI
ncbi:hypothetical protein Hypma_004959 [Hypsizygus marmoreus]|uniref:Aminoglycoside phosphotransferase domain-containing protein n=1 Tax=Hypsizygus marmoreus TaxID=39966 RepID=A0A369K0B9_HYPMA|nr:hypothetical protein Hypma_004959 [Hypsizygus marmoreus]